MGEATSGDCMRAAFQAILRGDYAERDRLCERSKTLIAAERYSNAVEKVLAIDFYVTGQGTAIPVMAMARAAGAIQS